MDPERYVAYYQNQAGNGLPGYAGGGVMYGAGLGGLFRGLHLDEQFTVCVMTVSHSAQMLSSFTLWHILHLSPFGSEK